MKELAIIINQNGEYLSFGTWKPNELRDKDNDEDWHDKCFRKSVYQTEWFQNLGIPYDEDLSFYNQLPMFAKCGIITIINDTNDFSEGSFIVAAPDTVTDEQIQVMQEMRDYFISFENNTSLIDVLKVDDDYTILESFYHIKDYYDYLDKIMEEKKVQKK